MDELDGLLKDLARYDAADVTAGAAAFQLMPANADRMARLLAAARLAAALPSGGRGALGSTRWRRLLRSGPLAAPDLLEAEDPYETTFAESFSYTGGPYKVPSGPMPEQAFVLRHLLEASLRLEPPLLSDSFPDAVDRLTRATLKVADTVCQRAGVDRGVELSKHRHRSVVIPSAVEFARLKRAVTFAQSELEEFFGPMGLGLEDLEPLVVERGAPELAPMAPDPDLLMRRPILRDGAEYVVAIPVALLAALRHAIVGLAREHALQEDLAARFHHVLRDSAIEALGYMGCRPLSPPQPIQRSEGGMVSSMVFELDTDKVLHMLLLTDPLAVYEPGDVLAPWPVEDLAEFVGYRTRRLEQAVYASDPAVREVLHLVLVQGLGARPIGWSEPLWHQIESPLQPMGVADLETLAWLEHDDPLLLWKWTGARRRLRERNPAVVSWGALDEYEVYRQLGYGYEKPGMPEPAVVSVPLGGAGRLRRRAQAVVDPHGVPYVVPGTMVQVACLLGDRSVPVYVPMPRVGDRVTFLVESLPLPVWVVGPDATIDPSMRGLYLAFGEMVSHWLWRLSPGLQEVVARLAGEHQVLRVDLELIPHVGWQDADTHPDTTLECVPEPSGALLLRIGSSIVSALSAPDNAGERAVMGVLLAGLLELAGEAGQESRGADGGDLVETLLDRYVPPGLAKIILVPTGMVYTSLIQEEGLPSSRSVHPADLRGISRDLGAHLVDSGFNPGHVRGARSGKVLDEAVAFLYRQLERLVAALSPDGLLEHLVAAYERAVVDRARRELSAAGRMACYGDVPSVVEHIRRSAADAQNTSTAGRFLIEYTAARPPSGSRRISWAVYDRLLALSWLITFYGSLADALRFGVVESRLVVEPRLGLIADRGRYGAALEAWVRAYAVGEAGEEDEDSSGYAGDETAEMEEATREEFGLPLSRLLVFLAAVCNAGALREGEPKVAPVAELLAEVTGELGWTEQEANCALEFFASRPRADYLVPPSQYKGTDVYPWRFNRRLSYLRKPLLVRRASVGDEVVWGVRHCLDAARYLNDLCWSGRLPVRTKRMEQLFGRLNRQRGDEFNSRVGALFASDPAVIVRPRVKKIAGLRIERAPGQPLGDIDVLVAVPAQRQILAIETKDLALARTPAELGNELAETFGVPGSPPADLDRHLERTEWLRQHLRQTIAWLGLDPADADSWEISPLLVIRQQLMGAYIAETPIPVITYRELRGWRTTMSASQA